MWSKSGRWQEHIFTTFSNAIFQKFRLKIGIYIFLLKCTSTRHIFFDYLELTSVRDIANIFRQLIEKCFLELLCEQNAIILQTKKLFFSFSGLFLLSLRKGADYLLVLKFLKLFFKGKAIYDYVLLLLQRYDTIS